MLLVLLLASPPPDTSMIDQVSGSTLARYAARAVSGVPGALDRDFIVEQIALSLEDKKMMGLELTDRELERTVVDYEIFKYRTFLSSGVFPKRYFGYFDGKQETAEHERTMKETVRAATRIINARQKDRGLPTRVTDMEIAVTFIAEGGALLLRERQGEIDRVHPIHGVGLDDIGTGFTRYVDLVDAFDEALGTELRSVVSWSADGQRVTELARFMSFREAILGTAVMWIYEKELAASLLQKSGSSALSGRSMNEQFIIGSLVYNSGLVFSPERVKMIESFSTAKYLAGVSRSNETKRWPLPLLQLKRARHQLVLEGYPAQDTSWSAVYHILQRYGGYVALQRFTEVFDDDGAYR